MVLRGSATSVALAEWLIQKLDLPADGEAFARLNDKSDGSLDTSDGRAGYSGLLPRSCREPPKDSRPCEQDTVDGKQTISSNDISADDNRPRTAA
jgi:hypothetical protein